jgi:hypothetical protein
MRRWTRGDAAAAGACLLAVSMSSTAAAQQVQTQVDGRAIHAHVTTLASPEWQGRRTLTPGFDKAAEWAAARFREWGLKPSGDAGSYFQSVPITGSKSDFVWTTGMPALAVAARQFSFREADFAVDASSTGGTDVTAEAVFAGYGISAPSKGLDEYAGIDAAGKVVFVLRGSPKDAPPEVTDFPGDPPQPAGPSRDWVEETTEQAKIATAYRKGAAAIVLCEANPALRRAAAWPKGRPARSPYTRPFVVVAANDAAILRAVMMRDPLESLPGFVQRINRVRRAVQQGHAQSEATGVRVRVKGFDQVIAYGESFGTGVSRNVVAKIEGTDPELKRQAVVVGAHLDHLGYRSGLVYPGADDNASGSAVVLEAARLFAAGGVRPKRTVVFALWCGEENGHHGSKRFTDSPPDGLALDGVVAYINMDMVGLGNGIEAAGARDFGAIFAIMMKDQPPGVARLVKPEIVGPGGSDYAPFVDHGVDAISLNTVGGQGHQDYHDAGDVASKIQPEMLGAVGQFVLQAATNLSLDTTTILPVPGRRATCDAIRFAPLDLSGRLPEGWRIGPARSARELQATVVGAIGELRKRGEPASLVVDEEPDPPPPALFSGVHASAAEGNLPLLTTAVSALGLGRVDVEGDDGVWVKGALAPAGKAMIAAMEQAGVGIHLVSPTPALMNDVLAVATRPVLVSGLAAIDAATAARVKERGAVVAVECDPQQAERCASGLQRLRETLGTSNLLVAMRVEAAAARDAHHALFKALAAKGWTKAEAFAVAGQAPDGKLGGNLSPWIALR